MAVTKTDYNIFLTNYEVKNGYIGDAVTLNKAVDQVKIELDAIYGWLKGESTADDGASLGEDVGIDSNGSYMNEVMAIPSEYHIDTGHVISVGGINTSFIVRSVDGLHKELFDGGSWN